MQTTRLPDTEYEIMELVWDSEPPVRTALVAATLGKARGWKQQTIVTLFGRLVGRGFLRAEQGKGREKLFYPIISREEYLKMETESFVDRYHKKGVTSLLAALHRDRLSDADLDELEDWLRGTREKR